jgi:hypothetical protein
MVSKTILYGLLAGLISIALSSVIYVSNPKLYVGSFTRVGLELAAYLPFMFLAARYVAKTAMDFKQVLRAAFASFLLANLLAHGMEYCMYNFYDTKLADLQKEMWVSVQPKTDVSDYKKIVDNINQGDYHTIIATLRNFAKGALGGFILSFITTYLVNRIES